MFNIPFLNIFKKKEKPMPEQVKIAEKNLPLNIKNLSVADLATKINKINQPNKWAITRFAASGKLQKTTHGSNNYPFGNSYQSEMRRLRRLKQIEKGMIQVTKEEA